MVSTTPIMTIEKMTPDELIENLKALQEAIPVLILLIKMGQHVDPDEAVDAGVEAPGISDDIFIESKI